MAKKSWSTLFTMATVNSFAPIEGISARILILGSMPGMASLNAGQYYAHPQNTFWKIMQAVLGINAAADYALRIEALKHAHIALWDVLESCQRPGSMDAAIDMRSVKTNDISALLLRQPTIKTIGFNGSMAEKIFRQGLDVPLNSDTLRFMRFIRLPSTSPAHASMPFERKVEAWRAAIAGAILQR